MKRDYNTGVSSDVTFFTGIEIEKTPALGQHTLFVVGVHPAAEIMQMARENNCTHIYFGANHSFPIIEPDDPAWDVWEEMIAMCLDEGFLCTLDMNAVNAAGLVQSNLVEYRNFIPMLAVKVPYLQQLGYNATIKIDDIDFNATNFGVWCHSLHSLTTREHFTGWREYGKDKIIK